MSAAESIAAVRVSAAAACLLGTIVLAWQFQRYLVVFPSAAAASVALELPLLLIGFAVFRLLRPVRPPPLLWSAAALVWGATAAAGCALLANRGLLGLWAKGEGVRFATNWSAALSAPLNEEVLKVCGVLMLALAAPRAISGPLDGLIYGALTGLGFQVTENVVYGLNNIVLSGATDPGQAVLSSMLVRVGTTGLGSHWTMTAVAGAGIGYLVAHGRRSRLRDRSQGDAAGSGRSGGAQTAHRRGGVLRALACLVTAMGMHLLFDAPALNIDIKVGVNFIIVAALYVLLRHAFMERARDRVAALAAAGVVGQTEAGSVLSRRRRRRELRRAASPAERDRLQKRQRAIAAELESEAA